MKRKLVATLLLLLASCSTAPQSASVKEDVSAKEELTDAEWQEWLEGARARVRASFAAHTAQTRTAPQQSSEGALRTRVYELNDASIVAQQRAGRALQAGDSDGYIKALREANRYRQQRDMIQLRLSEPAFYY